MKLLPRVLLSLHSRWTDRGRNWLWHFWWCGWFGNRTVNQSKRND